MLEIYNERIRDLLGDGKKQKEMNFSVQKDEVIGMMCPGLTSTGITDKEGAATAIALGNTNRSVGATNLNEQSSRSHMIVTLTVFSRNIIGIKTIKMTIPATNNTPFYLRHYASNVG